MWRSAARSVGPASSWTTATTPGEPSAKRVTIRRRKPVTKAQAEVHLREILAEIDAGAYVEPSGMTSGDLLDCWPEASIAVTMDVYSHALPGLQEAAAAKLDEILGESGHHQGIKWGVWPGK